jgi:hypothetical protein
MIPNIESTATEGKSRKTGTIGTNLACGESLAIESPSLAGHRLE